MDKAQLAWLEELDRQNQKTILIRELGTRYWDKDGNPVGSKKAKTVVPDDGTLNKLSVKGYTKKHKSRAITPIFYSNDDIIGMVVAEFGSGVRKEYIPLIISNSDYILAPKGLPPIGRSDNIAYLVSRGYVAEELNRLSEVKIRVLGNQERGEEKKKLKGKKVVKPRKFVTISQLPQWSQAIMRERYSKSGFAGRGFPTPDLPPALRAEMRGTALFPGVFSYRWADPFQLEHTIPGIEGGKHIPMQGGEPQFTAMLESEHARKTAEEARQRSARRKGLTVKGLPWLMAPAALAASSLLPGGRSMAETFSDPYAYADVATGLDTEKFIKGMQGGYRKNTGRTYTEDWNRFKQFWGGMPQQVMGLLKPEEKKKRESIWT